MLRVEIPTKIRDIANGTRRETSVRQAGAPPVAGREDARAAGPPVPHAAALQDVAHGAPRDAEGDADGGDGHAGVRAGVREDGDDGSRCCDHAAAATAESLPC